MFPSVPFLAFTKENISLKNTMSCYVLNSTPNSIPISERIYYSRPLQFRTVLSVYMYCIKDENKAWNVLFERVVLYISSLLPVGLHLTMGDFAFSAAIGQFISRGLTEAQSPKIEKKMQKHLEIYLIWKIKYCQR